MEEYLAKFMALPTLAKVGYTAGAGVFFMVTKYLWWRMNEKSKAFNAYTSNNDAINGLNLNGKIAVITGANNGIGLETARTMAKQGCKIIMACRSMEKAEQAKENILKSLTNNNNDQIITMALDLSSLESVNKFAQQFNSKNLKIDYLINNAGIMALPSYKTSKDGFEMQFATNHLGHFLLTHLLMPSLLRDSDSNDRLPRVINLSSTAHRYANNYDYMSQLYSDCIDEKEFMGKHEKDYNSWLNYGISKSANIFFARELQKRYKNELISVSLHPGGVSTGLSRHLTLKEVLIFFKLLVTEPSFIYKNSKKLDTQGAACSLRCVSLNDDEIVKGGYYFNCNERSDLLKGVASVEDGGKLAEKLWQLSQVLCEAKGYPLTP